MSNNNNNDNKIILREQMNSLSSSFLNITNKLTGTSVEYKSTILYASIKKTCCLCNKDIYGNHKKAEVKGDYFWQDSKFHDEYIYHTIGEEKYICFYCLRCGIGFDIRDILGSNYSIFSIRQWQQTNALTFLENNKEALPSISLELTELQKNNEILEEEIQQRETELNHRKTIIEQSKTKIHNQKQKFNEEINEQKGFNTFLVNKNNSLQKERESALQEQRQNYEIICSKENQELVLQILAEQANNKTLINQMENYERMLKLESEEHKLTKRQHERNIALLINDYEGKLKSANERLETTMKKLEAKKETNKGHLITIQESYEERLKLQEIEERLKSQITELEYQKEEQKYYYEQRIQNITHLPPFIQRTCYWLGMESWTGMFTRILWLTWLLIIIWLIHKFRVSLTWFFTPLIQIIKWPFTKTKQEKKTS